MARGFTEKQLRFLARAVYNDVNGLNPYEKKNIFKFSRHTTNHLVRSCQFRNELGEDTWGYAWYLQANLEKAKGGYTFNFRYDNIETEKIYFRKNTAPSEIYIRIANLQDTIPEGQIDFRPNAEYQAMLRI